MSYRYDNRENTIFLHTASIWTTNSISVHFRSCLRGNPHREDPKRRLPLYIEDIILASCLWFFRCRISYWWPWTCSKEFHTDHFPCLKDFLQDYWCSHINSVSVLTNFIITACVFPVSLAPSHSDKACCCSYPSLIILLNTELTGTPIVSIQA